MAILRTVNLTKRYKDKTAVDNVSLTVEKGDIFGLIGQNGAGKSTFMRMVTSLSRLDSGTVELFGEREAGKITSARTRMGAMIETPALFTNLSAEQNLEYYRLQRGIVEKNRIQEVLKIVNLTDTGKKKFKNFSLGMKQRLGLAVAMLSHPDFLIFDEPTNGLDPTGIVEMRDLIKRLNSEGITILISSHILTELAQVANKYAIIHHGKLLKTLTQSQLDEDCKRAVALSVDDASKATVVLEEKLGIKNYKQTSANEIRVYDMLEDTAELSYTLNQAGVRVSAMAEVGDSLEEYYTNLIRTAERGAL
ncbi:MAG: ABC transporter ATP-binding protein [Defluviitaleaceae bacterium]|nr:ABC transporter ATP-binding protein [Defluviitaleaceae bacterium]MCL2275430.1 ABC transporter ATP-binding protein [Defluviitaleaceae bacterium]